MKCSFSFALALLCAASLASAEKIEFRRLSPDDFRGSEPPPEMGMHPAGVDAVSCLEIDWPPELRVDFRMRGPTVTAVLREPRFRALFDRSCSWWGPTTVDAEYALAHEQVHFSIVEYQARRLTRESAESKLVLRGRGSSRDEALDAVRARLRRMVNSARIEARKEHDAFDAVTRRDRSTLAQQEWIDRYEHLLGTGSSSEREDR